MKQANIHVANSPYNPNRKGEQGMSEWVKHTMTAKQLADMLDHCQYGEEISHALEVEARYNNLVVVYGASDDLMEFSGAIDEECGAWEGTTVYLNKDGLLMPRNCSEDCPYYEAVKKQAKKITAVWNNDSPAWTYETDIPHETFEVEDDGEVYCRGIVFSMKDV